MNQKRLDEIKKRADAATPAPWTNPFVDKQESNAILGGSDRDIVVTADFYDAPVLAILQQDADFIAHARQDIPDLLEEIERLTAENAELKAVIGNLRRAISPSVEL